MQGGVVFGARLAHIHHMRIVMTFVFAALFALLAAAIYYAYGVWTALGAADLPVWMYAAMIGGVTGSVLVGCGLMALVFYSSRRGYDERASENDFTGRSVRQPDEH
jgi:hypothetical protein